MFRILLGIFLTSGAAAMRRRDFVKGGMTAWAASAFHSSIRESNMPDNPTEGNDGALENDLYRVEVDLKTGVIIRVVDKVSKVELITERRLAPARTSGTW